MHQISMKYKLTAALCAALAVLSLSACGNSEKNPKETAGAADNASAVTTLSAEALEGDFAYVMTYSTAILTAYNGTDEKVTVPETLGGKPVTVIGEEAFKEKRELVEITLPKTLSDIEDFAFWGCGSLKTVALPDGLIRIGDAAFMNCTSLSGTDLPASLESLGVSAFCSTKISSVTVPEKVTALPAEVFSDCPALVSVILPATVTDIDPDAFYGSDKVSITCAKGSAAESFSKENQIPYNAF